MGKTGKLISEEVRKTIERGGRMESLRKKKNDRRTEEEKKQEQKKLLDEYYDTLDMITAAEAAAFPELDGEEVRKRVDDLLRS